MIVESWRLSVNVVACVRVIAMVKSDLKESSRQDFKESDRDMPGLFPGVSRRAVRCLSGPCFDALGVRECSRS